MIRPSLLGAVGIATALAAAPALASPIVSGIGGTPFLANDDGTYPANGPQSGTETASSGRSSAKRTSIAPPSPGAFTQGSRGANVTVAFHAPGGGEKHGGALRRRLDFLAQSVVGMRYVRTGLCDDTLPERQRTALTKKAREIFGGSSGYSDRVCRLRRDDRRIVARPAREV